MKKICVITGTRAEYGLLSPLMKMIKEDDDFELQLVVTGMHLSSEFGQTYKEIEDAGFIISEKVETLLSSDSRVGVVKSIGLGTIGSADALDRLKPDILVILGDRFEMLATAQAALIMGIPIAHIHGGELTFGAYDDAIRHSITKMSTWHFVSTETHRRRVIQLGESPDRVFNVGAIGIENVLNLTLLDKNDLFNRIQIKNDKPYFLITYHPETNGNVDGLEPLLSVLVDYPEYNLVFTKANADNGGREINKRLDQYCNNHKNAYVYDSLGQQKYLSAVKHASAVIGNSSSGLIEVPYLKTPTVNCGDRQAGRECPSSVIQTDLTTVSINQGIKEALNFTGDYDQIFGDGNSSQEIINEIKRMKLSKLTKEFYDL